MRRLALTLPFLAAGLACTTHEPPLEPRTDVDAARRLEIGNELAGTTLSETADGPWQIRTTRSADTGSVAATKGVRSSARDDRELRDAEGASVKPGADVAVFVGGAGGGAGRGGGARSSAAEKKAMGGPAGPSTGAAPATRPAETAGEAIDAPPEAETLDMAGGLVAVRERREVAFDEPSSPAPVQNLKAGSTDDNADFEAYLEFLATWTDRQGIDDLYQPTDVSDRRFVRVVDVDGHPVPGAVVSIIDEVADRVLWTATTYGDGRVPYYPRLLESVPVGERGPLLIEAFVRDAEGTPRGVRAPWDGSGTEVQVALPDVFLIPEPVQLDVCFVIDTTGSMGDEIESIKASLLRVTEKLRGLDREFDLRYSAVLYRDIGDDYVTATHPFTEDIEAFDQALRGVSANGGGDGPESLNQAVAQAVDGVDWRDGAAKVAFLVADAPPHMDYAGDVPYGESARAALARGIRFHSVAASGLDPVGTLVFRQLAQLTRGKFIFIEYGTPAAAAESHGVAGEVKRNNLEDILFEQIRDEVATFGRLTSDEE